MFTCLLFYPCVCAYGLLFTNTLGAFLSNKKSPSVGVLCFESATGRHSVGLIRSSYDYCVTGHVIRNLEGVMVLGGSEEWGEIFEISVCARESQLELLCVCAKPDGK